PAPRFTITSTSPVWQPVGNGRLPEVAVKITAGPTWVIKLDAAVTLNACTSGVALTLPRRAEGAGHVLHRRQRARNGRLVVRGIHHRRAAERETRRQLIDRDRRRAGGAIDEGGRHVEVHHVADVRRTRERRGQGDGRR